MENAIHFHLLRCGTQQERNTTTFWYVLANRLPFLLEFLFITNQGAIDTLSEKVLCRKNSTKLRDIMREVIKTTGQ